MEYIDKQYLDLHNVILDQEVLQANRTNMPTLAYFGADIKLDLLQSFPTTTLSSTFNRGAFVELCWIYMRGDTNVSYLHEHNVLFWDQWAIEEDVEVKFPIGLEKRIELYQEKTGKSLKDLNPLLLVNELEDAGIPSDVKVMMYHKGDLGPVYGALAREFPAVTYTEKGPQIVYVDQIQELINTLKTNPGSRRHVVSLWQPGLLPDESISPQENVLKGKQALAPCHWAFVIMTEEIPFRERLHTAKHPNDQYDEVDNNYLIEDLKGVENTDAMGHVLDNAGIPRYRLNLHLIMRSSDVPAGLRLNIVEYAAMTHALAAECGMKVGKLWYTGTNAHIYRNQLDAVHEYIQNEPSEKQVRLWVNPDKSFFDLEPSDFKVIGYEPNKRVPVPVMK